jgi:aryl-alcohol dehydrogenase-like predicted oxidoreductase
MERRRLGRTGHDSSVAVLGCAALWNGTPEVAGEVLRLALDRGVNHLDVAPQYGEAERVLGPHLPAVRDRLFVGCKTLRKNPDGVRAQLETSLRLLGCDTFDLYQAHAVTDLATLDERSGAIEAILAARDEGVVRFAGITGHDMTAPGTFLEALRRHDLDTVMFPVNPRLWADAGYRRDAEALLAACAERDVGVMTIKAAARRPWADRSPGGDRWATTWYEPHREPQAVQRGVHFALSVPGVHAVCTPGDVEVLRVALDAAASFAGPVDLDAAAAADADEPLIFPISEHAAAAG